MKVSFPRLDAKAITEVPQLVGALNGYFGQLDAALQGQLGLENLRLELVEATAKIPDPTWTALAFDTNWGNLGGVWQTARYRMLPGGSVDLQIGAVTKSVALAAPDTIGILPVGYRPTLQVAIWSIGDTGASRIDVQANGRLVAQGGTAGGGGTFLLGHPVAFQATATGPCAPVLPFSGADWPLRIKTSLPSRAVGAWLAQAQDSESGASISVGPGAIDWEQDGDRRLVVRNVAGLQPGRTYRLRFLVLGA